MSKDKLFNNLETVKEWFENKILNLLNEMTCDIEDFINAYIDDIEELQEKIEELEKENKELKKENETD